MAEGPLVAIALAAYNPVPEFLRAQLDSFIAQEHRNWVCCLTFDSPLDAIRREPLLQKFFGDDRFRFFENSERAGLNRNFENALQLCLALNPDFVAYSDQDDVWGPNKLSLQLKSLGERSESVMSVCNMRLLRDGEVSNLTAWEIEKIDPRSSTVEDFLIRNICAGTASVFRADFAKSLLPIPRVDFPFHDWWTALLAANRGPIVFIREPLFLYRQHSANVLGTTAFAGRFQFDQRTREVGVAAKLIHVYRKSAQILRLAAEKIQIPVRSRILIAGFDFGLLYFLKAIKLWRTDPATSRNCIARGLGKILSGARSLWPPRRETTAVRSKKVTF